MITTTFDLPAYRRRSVGRIGRGLQPGDPASLAMAIGQFVGTIHESPLRVVPAYLLLRVRACEGLVMPMIVGKRRTAVKHRPSHRLLRPNERGGVRVPHIEYNDVKR